jgi:hypothetical protein
VLLKSYTEFFFRTRHLPNTTVQCLFLSLHSTKSCSKRKFALQVDRRPPLQLGGPPKASGAYGDSPKTTSCGRERLFSPPTVPGPRRGPLAITGHSRDAPPVQPFPIQKKPGDEHGSRLFKPASDLGTIPEAPNSGSGPPASKSRPGFKRLQKGKI